MIDNQNLQEQTVSGIRWRRCEHIQILNTYGQNPVMIFQDTEMLSIDEEHVPIGATTLTAEIDLDEEIELIDPKTLQPLGQKVPVKLVYAAIYTKYLQCVQTHKEEQEALREEARQAAQAGSVQATPSAPQIPGEVNEEASTQSDDSAGSISVQPSDTGPSES